VDFGTELRVTKTASEGPAWHIVISVKRGMFCRRKEIDENYPRSIFNLKTPHITRLAKATGLGQVFTGTFNLTSIFVRSLCRILGCGADSEMYSRVKLQLFIIYTVQCQLQFCARFSPCDLTYLFITIKLIKKIRKQVPMAAQARPPASISPPARAPLAGGDRAAFCARSIPRPSPLELKPHFCPVMPTPWNPTDLLH
jgi:hypothetical protein